MRRLRRVGITIILLVAAGLAASWMWLYSELEAPYYGSSASEVFVDIPLGVNAGAAADLLVRTGIIKHSLPFRAYLRYTDMGRHIQAGEYRFTAAASPKQIAQRLVQGDVFFYSITIPEGLTAHETIGLLAKNGLGNASEMEQALLKIHWIRDLNPKARNLEGYLFPETYRFRRNTDSETIIRIMADQFRAKFKRRCRAIQYPPDGIFPGL